MLKVDFHTHTIKSEHAINTLEETLHQAAKIGLEAVAVTDHCPGVNSSSRRSPIQTKEHSSWETEIKGPDIYYFNVLLTRYQAPPDIPVVLFKGIECNILSEGNIITDVPLKFAAQFDIVIASIHTFPFLFTVTSKDQVTEKMIEAMEHPIDIIGHPYIKSYCPHLEPVVKAAAEKRIALELNNNALQLNKASSEEVVTMLRFARKFHCRISLGSDSHMNNELGVDHDIDILIRELNFPKELIVNTSLADARSYIAGRKKYRFEFMSERKSLIKNAPLGYST